MGPNTLPGERWVAELFENQTCIAQNQCIGPSIKTLKTNLPFIGGKAAELSDWDHIGPRTLECSNIHYNWGETVATREQP